MQPLQQLICYIKSYESLVFWNTINWVEGPDSVDFGRRACQVELKGRAVDRLIRIDS